MAVTQQRLTAHGTGLDFEIAFWLICFDKKHRQSKHVEFVGVLNSILNISAILHLDKDQKHALLWTAKSIWICDSHGKPKDLLSFCLVVCLTLCLVDTFTWIQQCCCKQISLNHMLILNFLSAHYVLFDIVIFSCKRVMTYNPTICVTCKSMSSLLNSSSSMCLFNVNLGSFFLRLALACSLQI